MTDPHVRLLGVVLCGGRSQRMGHDKAMLPHSDGMSYLQHSVTRLESLCDAVYVSTSSFHAARYQGLLSNPLIVDPEQSFGPITGITQSLHQAVRDGFDACLFMPVDTPDLSVGDLQQLAEAYRAQPHEVVCAVAGNDSNRLEPLIAIYPTAVQSELRRSIERKQYSLQRALASTPVTRIVLPVTSCRNVNTPSDHSG